MDFLTGLVNKAKAAVTPAASTETPPTVADSYPATTPEVGARRRRKGGKKTKKVKAGRRTRRATRRRV